MALGGGGGGARNIRAGKAEVELGVKDSMSAALKRLAGRFMAFGKQVIGLTGIGGALGGVLAGLSFKQTADDLSKVNDVAKAFGITGKQASGLFEVLGAAGGEFKENLEGVIQFSGTLDKAMQGIGQGAELFDGLSVSAKELQGLGVDEQFYRTLAAIREMPQELQESKLALLGGTDSMKQWQRLLSMSSEEVRQIADASALSTAELEDAAKASRAMEAAGAAAGRVWQQTVIALAPLVAELATRLTQALKPVTEWLKGKTLQNIWDELLARGNVAWVELKIGMGNTFADIWDFFRSGWNSAVYVVKSLFADLGSFAAKSMQDALKGPLDLLEKVNPALAGQMRGALAAGGLGANVLRQQAQKEFDQAEAELRVGQKGRAMANDRLRAEAQNNLAAVLARIAGEVAERVKETPRTKKLDDKLAQIGGVLGTFAGVGSLTQAYGVRSAEKDVGKKLDQNNKLTEKGNDLLSKIADKVGPMRIT